VWLYVAQRDNFILIVSSVIVVGITVVVFCVPKTVQSLTFKIVILAVYCRFTGRTCIQLANRINGFGLNQPQLSLFLCHRLMADTAVCKVWFCSSYIN